MTVPCDITVTITVRVRTDSAAMLLQLQLLITITVDASLCPYNRNAVTLLLTYWDNVMLLRRTLQN